MMASHGIRLVAMAMLIAVGWSTCPGQVEAGVNRVPSKVREGLELLRQGELTKASEALDEARALAPEDQRILFDQACVKRAEGNWDEAAELFREAALAPDSQLALWCQYNLGQIDVERAKSQLGKTPETLAAEARATVKQYVAEAETHYRDCLTMDPTFEDGRHNLELLRRWNKHIDQVWHDYDRQKRRDSMDFAQFLAWMENQQRTLRTATAKYKNVPSSPKRRLDLRRTSREELELCEEVNPLKQKMIQSANAPQQTPMGATPGQPGRQMPMQQGPGMPGTSGQAAPSPFAGMSEEERTQAIDVLSQWADAAGRSMKTAAEYIHESALADAVTSQAKTIEQLDQIAVMLKPYPELVFQSVEAQKEQTTQSQSLVHPDSKETTPKTEEAAMINDDAKKKDLAAQEPLDPAEAAWNQRFVERWAQVLLGKAKHGLKNLPPEETTSAELIQPKENQPETSPDAAQEESIAKTEPNDDQTTRASDQPVDPQVAAAEQAKKQQEALRESMKRAVELGPRVMTLTAGAAKDLDRDQPALALPKQQEALKLLKKIAEPLKQPNQNQQQNQDQKDNQDKNQQQKNQDQKTGSK